MDAFERSQALTRAIHFALHLAQCEDVDCDVLRDFNDWWQGKIDEEVKDMSVQDQSRVHWREN